MKKTIIGIFASRSDAEKAINQIHNDLSIPNEEISFIYRNTEDEVKEVSADSVSSDTPGEGAKKGAGIGAVAGGLAGIAATAGLIPVVGPFFAAGPLLAALGIGGAVGITAAGAAGGAAVGGIIGALANLGVGKEKAKEYEDRVAAGDILLSVHADEPKEVEQKMLDCGATNVETYTVSV